jgi:hypothetical protein
VEGEPCGLSFYLHSIKMYIFSVNGQIRIHIYIMLNVNIDVYVPLNFDFNKIYSLLEANFARIFMKRELFILYQIVFRNIPSWNF